MSEQNIHNKNRTDYKKSIFLKILEKNNGFVGLSSRITKIPRMTVYSWIEKDEIFAKAVHDIRDGHLDTAEEQLVKSTGKGKSWAVMFLLSHRHPEYTPKQRVEVSGGFKSEDMD